MLGFYSRTNWPDATATYLDPVTGSTKSTSSTGGGGPIVPIKQDKSGPKNKEEPLYDGDTPEYNTKKMPAIPSKTGTTSKPTNTPASSGAVALDSTLDPKRVALIIETRPSLLLPALLTQFITTLPPQWVVRMVGSTEAFSVVQESFSLSRYIKSGKLNLTEIPDSYPVSNNEDLSATLTNLTFYSEFLAPAEWLLVFQTDSIICSASNQSLDDWVDKNYTWVGAPWNMDVRGGNGGLSLRNVPAIIEVLKNETRKANDPDWEDRWLCDRLKNNAPAEEGIKFSVESIYYERPLGYHLRGSGKLVDPNIWGNATRKRQIFKYCPETKLLLGNMNLEPASDKDDEKNENDAKGSAVSDVFKAAASEVIDAKTRTGTEAPAVTAAPKPESKEKGKHTGAHTGAGTGTLTEMVGPQETDRWADGKS